MKDPILVWEFCEAPEKYRALSNHGGDEDWLAFVPPGYERPNWTYGDAFGCCSVSEHVVDSGLVLIGAHA